MWPGASRRSAGIGVGGGHGGGSRLDSVMRCRGRDGRTSWSASWWRLRS